MSIYIDIYVLLEMIDLRREFYFMIIVMFSMSLMAALSLMLFDKKINDRFMTPWIIKSEQS